MARGFESKDVEFQQAEAARTQSVRRLLTSAEREQQETRRRVELTLANTRAERDRAVNPIYREMLERAIEMLEEQLGGDR